MNDYREEYRLQASYTEGKDGSKLSNQRTSETAFDTSSEIAMTLMRRAFDMLGIFPFDIRLADGFQV